MSYKNYKGKRKWTTKTKSKLIRHHQNNPMSMKYCALPSLKLSSSQTTPPFLPKWPKRLERFRFWFRALLLLSLLLYHLLNSCNETIKMIGSPCLCLGGWLCRALWGWCVPINFFLCFSTFFLNIVHWDLRNVSFWSGDVGFVLGHRLSTNRIVPLHDGKTAWNLQPCFCYESYK